MMVLRMMSGDFENYGATMPLPHHASHTHKYIYTQPTRETSGVFMCPVKPRGSGRVGSGRVGFGRVGSGPVGSIREFQNFLTRPDLTQPARFRKLPDPTLPEPWVNVMTPEEPRENMIYCCRSCMSYGTNQGHPPRKTCVPGRHY